MHEDIGKYYCFLPLDNIQIGNVIPLGIPYLIFGYPASRLRYNPSTKQAVRRGFSFITELEMDLKKWYSLNKNKQTNYLLCFSKKKIIREHDGKKIWAPDPYGLSGCGLWIEKNGKPLLVGIMNEFSIRESVMIGTRTDFYTELMRKIGHKNIKDSPLQIKYEDVVKQNL